MQRAHRLCGRCRWTVRRVLFAALRSSAARLKRWCGGQGKKGELWNRSWEIWFEGRWIRAGGLPAELVDFRCEHAHARPAAEAVAGLNVLNAGIKSTALWRGGHTA